MPLLRVEHLKKYYPAPSPLFGPKRFVRALVKALDDVSFELNEGETLGLVGESGCGKSTLARQLIRLENPTDGHIYLDDIDLGSLHGGKLRKMRGSFQMIFQDPYASLNPRMSVYSALEEALKLHSELDEPGRAERIAELLRQVGLKPEHARRYPHQFSGGQRQRIGIARALAAHHRSAQSVPGVFPGASSGRKRARRGYRDAQDARTIHGQAPFPRSVPDTSP